MFAVHAWYRECPAAFLIIAAVYDSSTVWCNPCVKPCNCNRLLYVVHSCRKNELEELMLLNLSKKTWTEGLLLQDFANHSAGNEKVGGVIYQAGQSASLQLTILQCIQAAAVSSCHSSAKHGMSVCFGARVGHTHHHQQRESLASRASAITGFVAVVGQCAAEYWAVSVPLCRLSLK